MHLHKHQRPKSVPCRLKQHHHCQILAACEKKKMASQTRIYTDFWFDPRKSDLIRVIRDAILTSLAGD